VTGSKGATDDVRGTKNGRWLQVLIAVPTPPRAKGAQKSRDALKPWQQTFPENGEGLVNIDVRGFLGPQWGRFRVVGGLLGGEEVLEL